MQAYEINQSAGDYLQFALNSINGRMRDYSTADRVDVYSPYGITNSTYTFTDSTPSSTAMTYQACTFDSLVDNYFTQVIIDFGGLVPVVVTSSGATEPYRVLQMNVKLFSGESIDYANYLVGVFDNPALEVSSLTCIGQAQSADDLAKICTDCINKRFAILFRGSTVYAICEGFTMSLDPGQTKVTYYFSTDNQYVADWLILDDSTNGKLDINRLGF
jgi:hypothetical protein